MLTQLREAQAARALAAADLARILVGTRAEVLDERRAAVAAAQATLTLQQQNYDRTRQLAECDFASLQKLDEITAARDVARRSLEQAKSALDEAVAGYTQEERRVAEAGATKADAATATLQAQVGELSALAARGFNSQSQLDESNAAMIRGVAEFVLRRAQLAAAAAGPTAEERALADAKVQRAEAAAAEARARLDKTQLLAPDPGVVATRIAEDGEVLTPGKPVLTIAPEHGLWFSFTAREDELRGLRIGAKTAVRIGASDIDDIVTEPLPLGEFGTWRAARAVGDHDLNSFRIRLDPVVATTALEPGMTALLSTAP